MKRLFKTLFNWFIIPFITLRKIFTYLSVLSNKAAKNTNILISNIREIPKKVKSGVNFNLIPINELTGFIKIASLSGGIERIPLPRIIGLSEGGNISVNMPEDYLCKLNNISFVPYSDFLRDGLGNVSNEKLLRKEYDVLIPRDVDLIKKEGVKIKLSSKKAAINVKIGFNLMGTYSHHWAHFFAQYYPKLDFLKLVPVSEEIEVIIPNSTDPHIKYLIEFEVKKYQNIRILEVDVEAEIFCEKLYHVSLGTFLADDGYFPTPFAIMISKSTLQFWKDRAQELSLKDTFQYRKIFIGRTGGRSLSNNNEIKNFFIEKGFEEVFPHRLNILDKIKIFNEAKYIVGPGSSGFVNSVYAKPGTKILAFFNSYRYLDTYLPAYSFFIGQEFWFMTGKDENLNEMNSNYSISLDELKLFLKDYNFLDDDLA